MTSTPAAHSTQPAELNPWVIVTPAAPSGGLEQLAVWRLATPPNLLDSPTLEPLSNSQPLPAQTALALFSDEPGAERYAQQFCSGTPPRYRVEQFSSLQLVAVLAECYRKGMRCAALNPSGTAAQQIFVLRDVLAAAKQRLRDTRNR